MSRYNEYMLIANTSFLHGSTHARLTQCCSDQPQSSRNSLYSSMGKNELAPFRCIGNIAYPRLPGSTMGIARCVYASGACETCINFSFYLESHEAPALSPVPNCLCEPFVESVTHVQCFRDTIPKHFVKSSRDGSPRSQSCKVVAETRGHCWAKAN
jgi:hypothetical protein